MLLDRFLTTVPGPRHRRALEVCARVRATTEDLLRAGLQVTDASDVFSWMRSLSFIEQEPFGLFPHDLVREVLDADMRWRDHDAYAVLNERIRQHLMQQLRRAGGGEQQRVILDLFYLQRDNPLFTPYVDFGDRGTVWQDSLRPGDAAQVRRLVTRTEEAQSAAIAAFWLDRQPEAFRVYRRPGHDEPVAVMAWLRLTGPAEEEIATDPVIAAARDPQTAQRLPPARLPDHHPQRLSRPLSGA
ncbi:hypothetical protein [Actinoplanes sp. URMC 104]|uniref:hypothetical protein n=1 Tax=Actinoplanes sp. URMC 104 TaxID=3423409 RepID=UPI003F1B1A5D